MLPVFASLLISASSVASFFTDPPMDMVTVSPDGAHIVYLASHKGRSNLFVAAIDGTHKRPLTAYADRPVDSYTWLNGSYLVFFKSQGGDDRKHAYALRLDGDSPPVRLNPPDTFWVRGWQVASGGEAIYLSLITNEGKALLTRVAIPSFETVTIATNQNGIVDWKVDERTKAIAASVNNADHATVIYRHGAEPMREVALYPLKVDIEIIGFTKDGRILSFNDGDADRKGVVALDPTRKRKPELLYQCENVDIWEVRMDAAGEIVDLLCQEGLPHHIAIDDQLRRLYDQLPGRLEGAVIDIVSYDRARRYFVVKKLSDLHHADYYLYDASSDTLSPLSGEMTSAASPEGEMLRVSYTTRDGVTIPAYLSLPSAPPGPDGYPAVVWIHGGPTWRVMWGYDPGVRFLVSRGYAVFQPNYRGSDGYSNAYAAIGRKRWGTLMQDDIADGARWLGRRKEIDAKRIGAMGHSFGGYSAQMQMARYGELYRCGVSRAGASDLLALATWRPYWISENLLKAREDILGDPIADRERLQRESPLAYAQHFTHPFFLAHGVHDEFVSVEQSRQMRDALAGAGQKVDYIEFSDEGHFLEKRENRERYFNRVADFLDQCLSPVRKEEK